MKMTTKFKYFSYGSNLSLDRIRLMNKSATFFCAARLTGFKFAFQTYSNLWKGATADIIRTDNEQDEVYGIIYELDESDLANLDKQEVKYNRIEVNVQKLNTNEFYKCWTYVQIERPEQKIPTKPSERYKQIVVNGAKLNNFPNHYVTMLESLESNGIVDCGPKGL